MTNAELVQRLRQHAAELARAGDNLYRVRAFRQAALVLSGLPEEIEQIVGRDGGKSLEDIPGIGRSLAQTIIRYVQRHQPTASSRLLTRPPRQAEHLPARHMWTNRTGSQSPGSHRLFAE